MDMDYLCKEMFEKSHTLRDRLNDLHNTNLKTTQNMNQKGKTKTAKIYLQANFMMFGGGINDF